MEKTAGWYESEVAALFATHLSSFVRPRKLGMVLGADGMFRFEPNEIRIPDVAFISKQRFAGRSLENSAFWELGCDLAVEVISPSNTRREMERKLDDYFDAGVVAVWLVYPKSREIVVHSSPHDSVKLSGDDLLDGGTILPGFSVPVSQIFAELDATEA